MIAFTPLLAYALSTMLLDSVGALPRASRSSAGISARDHHAHDHGHDHDHHKHGSGRTKVYADNPLVISGDDNHVHAHLDKRRHGRHGRHGRHRHHGTKVYADDPLVVSGNKNHVHLHSQKRGIIDPLVPLLSAIPGVPGVIDLAEIASHAVLSEKLASLIISPKPVGASAQSVSEGSDASGFVISASNSSSSIMYLLPQNTTSLAPPQQAVFITMPMFDRDEKGFKAYCASYDPNPSAPIQISSEPCMTNSTTPNIMSQLFSWNTDSGEITPLWHVDATQPLVDTTSAPGGTPDPASQGQYDGFMVGESATSTAANQTPSGTVAMIFRAVDSSPSDKADSTPSSTAAVEQTSTVGALEAPITTQSVVTESSTTTTVTTSSAVP